MSISIKKRGNAAIVPPAGLAAGEKTKATPLEYTVTGVGSAPNALRTQVVSNAFESEDEFKDLYKSDKGNQVIEPPYNLKTLDRLCQENNSLSPCIEGMVTNIDGTGFDFTKDDWGAQENHKPEDDPKMAELWDFFKEPFPGESYVSQRKRLRRDTERTGNAYLEVLCNVTDEIMFTRPMDAKLTRLVKLDAPVAKTVKMRRRGKDVDVTINVRERRYCQVLNGQQLVYFKDFGSERDLNKNTGEWAKLGERLPAADRASAVIHFKCLPDAHTPYGVPRWISQLPSILGSRKAEEYNLEYFDNGGVPPVMILIQGGVLAGETRKRLETAASGTAQKKNRVTVVEMEPTGGSLEQTVASKVTVERFGSERQSDSMFEKYDDKCEVRIRRAFRLPPIFVGNASDYSFATAFASYTVAEAQVFRLEREEHDEIMSTRFLPALGYPGYLMKSKAMNIEDATLKLQAIEVAITANAADPVSLMNALNDLTGLNLKHGQTTPIPTLPTTTAPGGSYGGKQPTKGATNSPSGKEKTATAPTATPARSPAVRKSADELADMAAALIGAIRTGNVDGIEASLAELTSIDPDQVDDLQMEVRDLMGTFADDAD